jgi:uncharacterized membrane protein
VREGGIRRPGSPVRSASDLVQRRRRLFELALAVVVVATGVVLRFWTDSDLWLDEALTVNISRLAPSDLLESLRHEAHPPVYYLLLHAWMAVFGESDAAVRALSGVIAVLALPLAWLAGNRLAGRSGGLATLLLVASSPFIIRYASEARMYSLVVLLVLGAWLAVRRALDRPSVARLIVVAALTGALLLTHYWAIYLFVATALAMAWLWWRSSGDDRARVTRVVIALAAGALTMVPWVVYAFPDQSQVETTFGPSRPGVLLAGLLVGVTSGEAALFGMVLVVLIALALFARPSGHTRMELDVRSASPVSPEVAVILATIALAALAGFVLGVAGEARHTTVALPLVLVVAAYGATRLPSWSMRTFVLCGASLCGLLGSVANVGDARTQAGEVARALRDSIQPGDLVVYCPDQLGPSVSRLLPDGVRSRTFPESDLAPERVSWTDYSARVEGTDPVVFAQDAVAEAGPATLWLVWYGGAPMVGGRCEAVARQLARLRPVHDSAVTAPSESQDAWFERAWLSRYPGA